MLNFQVKKSSLHGTIESSPSKSHTLRSILFASLAHGKSKIERYLKSPDTEAMIQACRQLGANIDVNAEQIEITGVAGKPQTPENIIDAGNSGQVLRFVVAIAALNNGYTILTGDHSVRHNRPMQPLLDGLTQLGAFCVSSKNDGYAPIITRGPITPGKATLSGEDSQPVSALLIAAAFLKKPTEIIVQNAGEKPWIDLTLEWLKKINVLCANYDYERYIVHGNANYSGFNYIVPGDFSSLLFPIVAALVTQSEITLQNVDMNDVQGDKKVIAVLQSMGAKIEYNATQQSLKVNRTTQLAGSQIDVNDFIDAVPILAVVGCYAQGQTRIVNAAIARAKESDRLAAIAKELNKMGAKITETNDGLIIEAAQLHEAVVQTYHDHRIAMALSIAALGATGITVIEDTKCIAKSYPTFCDDMQKLGANIQHRYP